MPRRLTKKQIDAVLNTLSDGARGFVEMYADCERITTLKALDMIVQKGIRALQDEQEEMMANNVITRYEEMIVMGIPLGGKT